MRFRLLKHLDPGEKLRNNDDFKHLAVQQVGFLELDLQRKSSTYRTAPGRWERRGRSTCSVLRKEGAITKHTGRFIGMFNGHVTDSTIIAGSMAREQTVDTRCREIKYGANAAFTLDDWWSNALRTVAVQASP